MSALSVKLAHLTWAFSSCPNDTFAFDALIHGRLADIASVTKYQLLDIEQLNRLADSGEPDVVKVSAAHYPAIRDRYRILDSGAALGFGVGPLLVYRQDGAGEIAPESTVAIPGLFTTANALLSYIHPQLAIKKEIRFDQIPQALQCGDVDFGVLIHEGRFTYAEQGLALKADLGEEWEQRLGLPIPLGIICVKRSLPESLQEDISDSLRQSVLYAWNHPEASQPFIQQYAQEMDPKVQQSHIHLYVNDFTASLGEKGREAMRALVSAIDADPLQDSDFVRL